MSQERGADILIVDDLPENLKLLSDVLSAEGYNVRPAPDGRLAIRAAQNQTPDLVMLDINMPDMDGFEVCRIMKEDPELNRVPVIFISALTETLDKVKAFDVGGVDYVTKPFEPKVVLARVKAHSGLHRAQLDLQRKNEALKKALNDLKAAQVKLVQSEKMASLGVLTAGLAHEINNPINFVSSGVKGLARVQADLIRLLDAYGAVDRGMEKDAARQIASLKEEIGYHETRSAMTELTDAIFTGVRRTEEIIEGMRIFARPDDQGKKMVEIDQNLDSALMLLQNRTKRTIKVVRDYEDLPMVLCYPGRLNQVFVNLLSNAIDAIGDQFGSEPGGLIKVSTKAESRNGAAGQTVAISDNGAGMPDDVKKHIFEPFFTTKDVGQGVGLGLSISHGIVEEHGGQIDLTSSNETGTTFSVWIPTQAENSDGE